MIRYDTSLTKELNTLVRNYNAKVRRLEKKGVEAPRKLTTKELKRKFTTRKELKRELKELSFFTKRGSEEKVKIKNDEIEKYKFHRIKSEVRRAKYTLTRQIKIEGNKPFVFQGRKTSAKVSEFPTEQYRNLKAKRQALNKDLTKLNRGELERISSRSRGDISGISEKDKSLYWNYWDAINDLGTTFGINQDRLETIRKKLFSLGLSGFTRAFNNEQILKDLISYYVPKYLEDIAIYAQAYNDVNEIFNQLEEKIDKIVEDYS